MPDWRLFPYWEGSDVFILGGGPSLRTFPVSLLQKKKVIGCNDAYLYGSLVTLLHFGDVKWYNRHKEQLRSFTNPIIHSNTELINDQYIYYVPRMPDGWSKSGLGWNGNTGCSAINLALLMGAKNIYLLGFDMKLGGNGESNWHPNDLDAISDAHYQRYILGFRQCVLDLKKHWPEATITNLNPDSALDDFPKRDWAEVLEGDLK